MEIRYFYIARISTSIHQYEYGTTITQIPDYYRITINLPLLITVRNIIIYRIIYIHIKMDNSSIPEVINLYLSLNDDESCIQLCNRRGLNHMYTDSRNRLTYYYCEDLPCNRNTDSCIDVFNYARVDKSQIPNCPIINNVTLFNLSQSESDKIREDTKPIKSTNTMNGYRFKISNKDYVRLLSQYDKFKDIIDNKSNPKLINLHDPAKKKK